MQKFSDYLIERFSAAEIAEIGYQAQAQIAEIEAVEAMQQSVAQKVNEYMAAEKINFSELVSLTGFSPAKVSRICQGKANLTLTNIAHLATKLGKKPQLIL